MACAAFYVVVVPFVVCCLQGLFLVLSPFRLHSVTFMLPYCFVASCCTLGLVVFWFLGCLCGLVALVTFMLPPIVLSFCCNLWSIVLGLPKSLWF